MNRRQAVLGLALVTLVAACGSGVEVPPLGKVTGVVTLNGTPTAGINVAFHPQAGGKTVEGVTNDKGEYSLQYNEGLEGAIVGVNDVTLSWAETDEEVQRDKNGEPHPPTPKPALPDSYEKTATVKAEGNTYNFDLK
ncbi:MAG: hypothetical protein R3C01_15030 [Planctomycetaceae bacterium]